MVDGLLTWFHFTIFCIFCYVFFRRYFRVAELNINAEKEREHYLMVSRNNVQNDVQQAKEAIVEQEAFCQIMYSKVQHWRESFLQDQLQQQKEFSQLQKELYKRHKEMSYGREIYSLNKELLPQVIDRAREELKKRYASVEAGKRYNQRVIDQISKISPIPPSNSRSSPKTAS